MEVQEKCGGKIAQAHVASDLCFVERKERWYSTGGDKDLVGNNEIKRCGMAKLRTPKRYSHPVSYFELQSCQCQFVVQTG